VHPLAAAYRMKKSLNWKWIAQCAVVLVLAYSLKLFYSNASANDLQWILAPTTALVQLVSREPFEFESHAGYINEDHSFLIASSCAGVNFMITVFVMLAGMRLLSGWKKGIFWKVIPAAAVVAYLVTIVANTTRIAIALRMQRTSVPSGWLDHDQMHRFEGIAVYFGGLLLLFVLVRAIEAKNRKASFAIPIVAYLVITLGLPLANGAAARGEFAHHALLVVIPCTIAFALVAVVAHYKRRTS